VEVACLIGLVCVARTQDGRSLLVVGEELQHFMIKRFKDDQGHVDLRKDRILGATDSWINPSSRVFTKAFRVFTQASKRPQALPAIRRVAVGSASR
jgi:hypothetical protein